MRCGFRWAYGREELEKTFDRRGMRNMLYLGDSSVIISNIEINQDKNNHLVTWELGRVFSYLQMH